MTSLTRRSGYCGGFRPTLTPINTRSINLKMENRKLAIHGAISRIRHIYIETAPEITWWRGNKQIILLDSWRRRRVETIIIINVTFSCIWSGKKIPLQQHSFLSASYPRPSWVPICDANLWTSSVRITFLSNMSPLFPTAKQHFPLSCLISSPLLTSYTTMTPCVAAVLSDCFSTAVSSCYFLREKGNISRSTPPFTNTTLHLHHVTLALFLG